MSGYFARVAGTWVEIMESGDEPPLFTNLAVTQLTQAATTTDAVQYVTASVSPTANRLVCVWIATSSSTNLVTAVTGNGITYNQIGNVAGASFVVALFAGVSASPSAGAITIDFAGGGHTGIGYRVEEWTASVTPAVRQFKTGENASAVSTSLTLDSPVQSTSAVAMIHVHGNTNSSTVGQDFTATLNTAVASPSRTFFHEFDILPVDGTADCTWVTAAPWMGLVAEIGAPL